MKVLCLIQNSCIVIYIVPLSPSLMHIYTFLSLLCVCVCSLNIILLFLYLNPSITIPPPMNALGATIRSSRIYDALESILLRLYFPIPMSSTIMFDLFKHLRIDYHLVKGIIRTFYLMEGDQGLWEPPSVLGVSQKAYGIGDGERI